MASLQTVSFASLKEACFEHRLPRGLSRANAPIMNSEAVEIEHDSFSGVAILTKHTLVLIDKDRTGIPDPSVYDAIAEYAAGKADPSGAAGIAGSETLNNEDEADDNENESMDESETASDQTRPLDLMVWASNGSDDASIAATYSKNGRIVVQVADAEGDAKSICDLVTSVYKAVIMPFEGRGGRLAWKEAQRPKLQSDYVDGEGEFKLSFEKRYNNIVSNTLNRVNSTYDSVADAKFTSVLRVAAGRFARKHNLVMTWKAQASSDSVASKDGTADEEMDD